MLGGSQPVRVVDSDAKHYMKIGRAVHWEGNDVYVAFSADDATTPPARLAVDEIELIETQVNVGDSVKIVDSTSKVFGHRGVVLTKEELETGSPRSLRIVDQSLILDAQGVNVKPPPRVYHLEIKLDSKLRLKKTVGLNCDQVHVIGKQASKLNTFEDAPAEARVKLHKLIYL